MSEEWPPYLLGTKDQFHALGVIAATFNVLENRLLGLLLLYVGFNDITTFLFQRLRDNSARIDLLSRAVSIGGETPEIKEAVLHFKTGFDRCAQNRNVLMHSTATSLTEGGQITHLVFSKAAKDSHLGWNRFLLDLPTLRRVADETNLFAVYGRKIFTHVVARYREQELMGPFPLPAGNSLPDKPPLPALLSPQQFP